MGEAVEVVDVVTSPYVTELMTPKKFALYWEQISTELDKISHIWEAWFTKDFLRRCVGMPGYYVWGTGTEDKINIIVFSSVLDGPKRVLQIFIVMGNDFELCLPSLRATLEKFANDTGCQACEIIGRKGWEKILSDFKPIATVYRKELTAFGVQ